MELGKENQTQIIPCQVPKWNKTSGESDEKNSSKAKGNNPQGTTMETPKAKCKMPY